MFLDLVVPLLLLIVHDVLEYDIADKCLYWQDFYGGIDHMVLLKNRKGTSQEPIEHLLQAFKNLSEELGPSTIIQLTAGWDPWRCPQFSLFPYCYYKHLAIHMSMFCVQQLTLFSNPVFPLCLLSFLCALTLSFCEILYLLPGWTIDLEYFLY